MLCMMMSYCACKLVGVDGGWESIGSGYTGLPSKRILLQFYVNLYLTRAHTVA